MPVNSVGNDQPSMLGFVISAGDNKLNARLSPRFQTGALRPQPTRPRTRSAFPDLLACWSQAARASASHLLRLQKGHVAVRRSSEQFNATQLPRHQLPNLSTPVGPGTAMPVRLARGSTEASRSPPAGRPYRPWEAWEGMPLKLVASYGQQVTQDSFGQAAISKTAKRSELERDHGDTITSMETTAYSKPAEKIHLLSTIPAADMARLPASPTHGPGTADHHPNSDQTKIRVRPDPLAREHDMPMEAAVPLPGRRGMGG